MLLGFVSKDLLLNLKIYAGRTFKKNETVVLVIAIIIYKAVCVLTALYATGNISKQNFVNGAIR